MKKISKAPAPKELGGNLLHSNSDYYIPFDAEIPLQCTYAGAVFLPIT